MGVQIFMFMLTWEDYDVDDYVCLSLAGRVRFYFFFSFLEGEVIFFKDISLWNQ